MNKQPKVKHVMTNSTTEPMTTLVGGYKVPTWFYLQVRQEISAGVAAMLPNTLYLTKELCGEEYWGNFPKPENKWKRDAGRCFADMVSKKLFPVKFVQYKRSRSKHYKLK